MEADPVIIATTDLAIAMRVLAPRATRTVSMLSPPLACSVAGERPSVSFTGPLSPWRRVGQRQRCPLPGNVRTAGAKAPTRSGAGA